MSLTIYENVNSRLFHPAKFTEEKYQLMAKTCYILWSCSVLSMIRTLYTQKRLKWLIAPMVVSALTLLFFLYLRRWQAFPPFSLKYCNQEYRLTRCSYKCILIGTTKDLNSRLNLMGPTYEFQIPQPFLESSCNYPLLIICEKEVPEEETLRLSSFVERFRNGDTTFLVIPSSEIKKILAAMQ